jgi:hypothetical protein
MKILSQTMNEERTGRSLLPDPWIYQMLTALLCLFLFFLPIYEAPKNIFGGLFLIVGLLCLAVDRRSVQMREYLRRPHNVALMILIVSPFFAGLGTDHLDPVSRFRNALNWSSMPAIVLVFTLLPLRDSARVWALRSICVGVIVAVVMAFISWRDHPYPELNSVGHVNQSALYLAFALVAAGYLWVRRSTTFFDGLICMATVVAVLTFLGPAKSIVAVVTSMIGLLGIGVFVLRQVGSATRTSLFVTVCIALVSTFAIAQWSQWKPYTGLLQEIEYRLVSESDPWSQRDRLVLAAWTLAGTSINGYGLGSFGQVVTVDNLAEVTRSRGMSWAEERHNYFTSSHGHNLFANVLVERGWLGIVAVGLALILIAMSIIQKPTWSSENVLGATTLAMILVAGLGQSALHVEHGQLALILLGFGGLDSNTA